MDFINAIPGIFVIIGGLMLFAIGIIWVIFPFLVCARLDKIKKAIEEGNMQAIRLAQRKPSQYAD